MSQWTLVGTTNTSTYAGNASTSGQLLQYFSINVNSTLFIDGQVQLKVVANTTAAGEITVVKGATVANKGMPLCYTISDEGGHYPLHRGFSYSFTTANCSTDLAIIRNLTSLYLVTSVSYYAETMVDDLLSSKFISTSTAEPFQFTTLPVSYPDGTQVTFKAVVNSISRVLVRRQLLTAATFTTSTLFTAVVAHELPTSMPSSQPTSVPTQPSSMPSSQPTAMPSGLPTAQPSGLPTAMPTQPTGQPTGQPSSQPSGLPSSQPTSQPTMQPSGQPTCQPSGQPSGEPTGQPSGQPSSLPTGQPTGLPSGDRKSVV